MVNEHLSLKLSLFHIPLWCFQNADTCKVLVLYCYNIKDKCLKISDSYLYKNKSYGCVKNGMLYSDDAKIKNTRLALFMNLCN